MKVCLVIIYNHNFEKNVEVLDRIYADRFSAVWHVMPFYNGNRKNVIGVYECSYQFSGYIAQASRVFARSNYTHYVFVADDMVINPVLNEANIVEYLRVGDRDGFVAFQGLLTNNSLINWCGWSVPGCLNMLSTSNATEWRGFMPTISEARSKFESVGLDWRDSVSKRFLDFVCIFLRVNKKSPYAMRTNPAIRLVAKAFSRLQFGRDRINIESRELIYPVTWGYADFVVVPQCASEIFFRYCGIFAAMRQFVEIAIPTALTLACDKVLQLCDIGLHADPPGVDGVRLSSYIEETYSLSYKKFLDEYPKDYVFIHPVKLSRWEDLP